MIKEKQSHRILRILLVIFIISAFVAGIMPYGSKSEIQTINPCAELEDGSWQQEQNTEEENIIQIHCSTGSNKELINLLILGIINIDELSMWVLGVDRRLVVLKMMHEKRMIQASEIADSTDRSLQNISYAMRELEERGLIRCLTPDKHTWKKYIPTEKGTEVFEKLKKNRFID
ncbi:MAG: hypothetical protein WAW23_00405 [Candidatus Methanoperedens sp.]